MLKRCALLGGLAVVAVGCADAAANDDAATTTQPQTAATSVETTTAPAATAPATTEPPPSTTSTTDAPTTTSAPSTTTVPAPAPVAPLFGSIDDLAYRWEEANQVLSEPPDAFERITLAAESFVEYELIDDYLDRGPFAFTTAAPHIVVGGEIDDADGSVPTALLLLDMRSDLAGSSVATMTATMIDPASITAVADAYSEVILGPPGGSRYVAAGDYVAAGNVGVVITRIGYDYVQRIDRIAVAFTRAGDEASARTKADDLYWMVDGVIADG